MSRMRFTTTKITTNIMIYKVRVNVFTVSLHYFMIIYSSFANPNLYYLDDYQNLPTGNVSCLQWP